jgi:hypothetical protein
MASLAFTLDLGPSSESAAAAANAAAVAATNIGRCQQDSQQQRRDRDEGDATSDPTSMASGRTHFNQPGLRSGLPVARLRVRFQLLRATHHRDRDPLSGPAVAATNNVRVAATGIKTANPTDHQPLMMRLISLSFRGDAPPPAEPAAHGPLHVLHCAGGPESWLSTQPFSVPLRLCLVLLVLAETVVETLCLAPSRQPALMN